jgi:hypothetical protein
MLFVWVEVTRLEGGRQEAAASKTDEHSIVDMCSLHGSGAQPTAALLSRLTVPELDD